MPDNAAIELSWRQVLADVGYLRGEVARLGPRAGYIATAQRFDLGNMRDVAAFERVYERLANEVDHLVRDCLKAGVQTVDGIRAVDDASMGTLLGGFATSRKLPAASRAALQRAAHARNDLQHDYLNLRAAEVFDGVAELLDGIEPVLRALQAAWAEHGLDLKLPRSSGR